MHDHQPTEVLNPPCQHPMLDPGRYFQSEGPARIAQKSPWCPMEDEITSLGPENGGVSCKRMG